MKRTEKIAEQPPVQVLAPAGPAGQTRKQRLAEAAQKARVHQAEAAKESESE